MKHTMKKFLLPLFAVVAVTFGACSDWTRTESLAINQPSIDKQNPELYKQYLEALNGYKTGDHKVVMVSMPGRTTAPGQQNHHLTTMPDSVDYICLTDPADLHPMLAAEIAQVRKKGTRVIYNIDYNHIELLWKQKLDEEQADKSQTPAGTDFVQDAGDQEGDNGDGGEQLTPEEELELRFLEFCRQQTLGQLSYCDRYGLDGVEAAYQGRSTINMTEEEKAQYAARQQAFVSELKNWRAAHSDKQLIFRGNPQNLLDKSLLGDCAYIVIPALTAVSGDELSFVVLTAAAEGVPTDRFIIGVKTPSISDPADESGYFSAFEADGKTRVRAIKGAAEWTLMPASYTKAGIAVADAQNDYFNTTLVYKNIREAIDFMNPAPKK